LKQGLTAVHFCAATLLAMSASDDEAELELLKEIEKSQGAFAAQQLHSNRAQHCCCLGIQKPTTKATTPNCTLCHVLVPLKSRRIVEVSQDL
jgi:hypothetical protein